MEEAYRGGGKGGGATRTLEWRQGSTKLVINMRVA